jgi:hypothetical protein
VTVTFSNYHARTSHANSIAYNERIATAIADLKSQNHLNITATAKKYKVARIKLSDRFKGKSSIIKEVNSYIQQ